MSYATTEAETAVETHEMIVRLYQQYKGDHIAAIREASKIQRDLSRAEHEVNRIERHLVDFPGTVRRVRQFHLQILTRRIYDHFDAVRVHLALLKVRQEVFVTHVRAGRTRTHPQPAGENENGDGKENEAFPIETLRIVALTATVGTFRR